MPEAYSFLEKADNGFVNGTVEVSGEIGAEDIAETRYSPEDVSEYADVDHDVSYDSFDNQDIAVDEVKIDRDLGIIDVFYNGQLEDRYSLLGIIDDESETQTHFGKQFGDNTEVLTQEGNDIGNWGPELAAAYEALDQDISLDDSKEKETVSLTEPEEDDYDFKLDNYSQADARSDAKQIDDALGRLEDVRVNDISEFETRGEVNITGNDHLSASGKNGARGFHAARRLKHKFGKLKSAGIIDYELESLTQNGDSDDVNLTIAQRYMSSEGVEDEFDAISDEESLQELVDQRFNW